MVTFVFCPKCAFYFNDDGVPVPEGYTLEYVTSHYGSDGWEQAPDAVCEGCKPNFILPTIHLNGTSRRELMRQVLDARHAVQLAIIKLGEASPNGRDYYPQDRLPEDRGKALRLAQLQHLAWIAKLQNVHDDLGDYGEAILDANPGR